MSCLVPIWSAAAFDHPLLVKCVSRILLSQLFNLKRKRPFLCQFAAEGDGRRKADVCGASSITVSKPSFPRAVARGSWY